MIIRSRAPTRISFAGGGTDVPPYCDEKGGCVISAAINRYAYSTLETRNDQEIHIESGDFLKRLKFTKMDDITYNNELDVLKAAVKRMSLEGEGLNLFMKTNVPPGSGLGGSASAFVSLIGLFDHLKGKKMTNYEIANLAHKLEREELKILGGKQDQYAASFGGINFIEFKDGHVIVNPLKIKDETKFELEKHLLLAYTGDRDVSNSGDIISDQTKSVANNESNVLEAHDKYKELALEVRDVLKSGDLNTFGNLIHKAWEIKKSFSGKITNKRINDLYDFARKNGAIGGKISGAGGGGFMMFFCEPNKEHNLTMKLEEKGFRTMPFAFDFDGLQTWEVTK